MHTINIIHKIIFNSPWAANPGGLAVASNSHHALVVSVGGDIMCVIDTATATVIRTSSVSRYPDEVASAPDNTA